VSGRLSSFGTAKCSDGLLTLIEMTRVHLFKEAWYRETGAWLGEEVSHQQRARSKACRSRRHALQPTEAKTGR
jgi:hypothetical protein